MADLKISALTASTTPLAGTEVLPIVQSSTTKQVSVANLTAGRNVSLAQLTATATTQKLGAVTSADITVQIGPDTPVTTSSGRILFNTSSTEKNWFLTHNWNVAGAVALTQSTAAGGSTMSGTDSHQWLSNGDYKIVNGNVVIGTSGKGITDSTGGLTSTYNSTGITTNGTNSAGQVYRTGTYTDGATTPSVLGVSHLVIANSGATSITNFTNAVNGQILTLIFNDANTTVTRNNAYLSLGLNFTSTANDTLTLIYRGSDALWYEVCRSVNA